MIESIISRGYSLVPVRDKRPYHANWPNRDFTAADLTGDYGIKLGGLLDIEGDGPDAETMADCLALPPTVSWQSSRGIHRLYKLTADQEKVLSVSGKIKLGDLEFRTGHNAQSVLPPANGRTWITSLETDDPTILPDSIFRQFIADKETEFVNIIDEDRPQRPGDVFNENADWTDTGLIEKGWTKVGGNKWCRPGKAGEVSATTDYCQSDTRGGLFWCFSTSEECLPVKHETSYSKFDLFTLFHFDGNYGAAAAYLAANGYSVQESANCDEFEDYDGSIYTPVVKGTLPAKDASKEKIPKHPTLCLDTFTNPLTDYCLALKDISAADVGAIWFQLNEILFNFLGRNPHFVWSGKEYYINGSLFIVGPTATGKKGLSLSAAKAPFNPLIAGEFSDDIAFATYEPLMAGGYQSGQAILTHFMKDKDDIGEKDKRLMMIEQESAALMKMGKVENSILSQVMRTAFDGDKLEYRVSKIKGKESTVSIKDAHVSLIGHITADELLQVLTVGSDKTGELNRIQFVLCLDSKFVKESKSNFLYKDIRELQILREHILKCAAWSKGRQIIFPNALYDHLDDYTERHENNLRNGTEKPVNARLPLYLRKWIARFAVLDLSEYATIKHYNQAMMVIQYLRDANAFILGEWLDGVDKDLIDKAILTLQESHGGATRAVIGKELFGSHWTVDKVEGVLLHVGKRLALSGKTLKEKKDRNKVIYHL